MLLPFVGLPILFGLMLTSGYLLFRKSRRALSLLCIPCAAAYGWVLVRDIILRSGCYICVLPRPAALWTQGRLILGFGLLFWFQLRGVYRLCRQAKKVN